MGCISLPPSLDLERGACVVALPDREDICLEITLQECFSLGEFNGVGSTCESHGSHGETVGPVLPEPTPLYLNKDVIYSIAGTVATLATAWAGNKAIRRRRKRGTK